MIIEDVLKMKSWNADLEFKSNKFYLLVFEGYDYANSVYGHIFRFRL